MKKNLAVFSLFAVLACVCVCVPAFGQDHIVTLEHNIFVDRQRPAALFSHTVHADDAAIDCLECHHIYDENGENVWEDSEESDCTACHLLDKSGKAMPAMEAFHANCKGCHVTEGKGPLTCGECHPRTKKVDVEEVH